MKNNDQDNESGEDLAMVSTTSALSNTERDQRYKWIYDSGETNHICNFRDYFEIAYTQLGWVQVGNSEGVQSYGRGDIRVSTRVDGKTCTVLLTGVTLAPEMMLK